MEDYYISYIYNESNTVADVITNEAMRCQRNVTWQGDESLHRTVMSCMDYDLINGRVGVIMNKDGYTQKYCFPYFEV